MIPFYLDLLALLAISTLQTLSKNRTTTTIYGRFTFPKFQQAWQG
jgi:hypothetical protein